MLKAFRISFSILIIALFILAFSGLFSGSEQFPRVVSATQLIPSLILCISKTSTGALFVFISITVFTLLFGRAYCSMLCPLGIIQDGFIYLRLRKPKNKGFSFIEDTRTAKYTRCTIGVVTVLSLAAGITIVAAFLDPYSLFGKMLSGSVMPATSTSFNVVLEFLREHNLYRDTLLPLTPSTGSFTLVSLMIIVFIGASSIKRGRWFCNHLCPAGALLGFLSRYSFARIHIASDTCTSCGLCERTCKSECISSVAKTVDNERCVRCFNCVSSCKLNAATFTILREPSKTPLNNERRGFIRATIALGTLAAASILTTTRALATKIKGIVIVRKNPVIIPPGSGSIEHLNSSCTGCGLCAANCPNSVITMSLHGTGGAKGMMKPVLDYSLNYCLSECNTCSLICPTGAISPIIVEQKRLTQIGEVQLIKENCLAWMDYEYCTVCEEYCPTKAVYAAKHPDVDIPGHTVPKLDTSRCIGCGACEFMCPARPEKAIYIEGKRTHTLAQPPAAGEKTKEEKAQETLEEFPF